jgi:hypothetical protein
MINEENKRLQYQRLEFFGPPISKAGRVTEWIGENGIFRKPSEIYEEHKFYRYRWGDRHPGYDWLEHVKKGKL